MAFARFEADAKWQILLAIYHYTENFLCTIKFSTSSEKIKKNEQENGNTIDYEYIVWMLEPASRMPML